MLTGRSCIARGAAPARSIPSDWTTIVTVQVPDGQPICSVCWHGAPAW